jgi:hypothetical protein
MSIRCLLWGEPGARRMEGASLALAELWDTGGWGRGAERGGKRVESEPSGVVQR